MRSSPSIFLIYLFGILPGLVLAQNRPVRFNKITSEDGLSQSHVTAILKDNKGFMWFGTFDGLNQYDGYGLKVHKHDPEILGSISSDFIQAIFEDKSGNLWIGSAGGGLSLYDRANDKFINYLPDENDPKSISVYTVQTIYEDKKGNLWLGSDKGLEYFNPQTQTFKYYQSDSLNLRTIKDNQVVFIGEDHQNRLWVVSETGIQFYNPERDSFIRLNYFDSNIYGNINQFLIDSDGHYWIGTHGKTGLYFLDIKKELVIPIEGLTRNKVVYALEEDEEGNLLIGTESGGFYVLDKQTRKFTRYSHEPADDTSLNDNSIQCIYQSNDGIVWLGTNIGGVNFYNKNAKPIVHFQHQPNKNSLSGNNVLCIKEDNEGIVWIGTDGKGLNRFNRANNHFEEILSDQITDDVIRTMGLDAEGNLWLGTFRGGLNILNNNKTLWNINNRQDFKVFGNRIEKIYLDQNGDIILSGNKVYRNRKGTFQYEELVSIPERTNIILQDRKENYWFGTHNGLYRLKKDDRKFKKFNTHLGEFPRLSANGVTNILEDSKGNIWVGTSNGLNVFQEFTETFKVYKEKDGLTNNNIHGLLEDDRGNLWISTNNGISKLQDAVTIPEDPVFKNLNVEDGLQGKEFNTKATFRNKNGEMYFGGKNGFNLFHPDSITENEFIPPVVFTGFKIFNKDVPIDPLQSPLHKHISETDTLYLSYEHSVFTIAFAVLNFLNPGNNQYAFKLENFEKNWNYVDNQRSATYTNLDPGTYTFRVIGSNNDGKWNRSGASLTIIISPPWWETNWFRFLAIALVVVSFYAFYKIRTRNYKQHNLELERKVKLRTAELMEVNEELQLQKEQISNHVSQLTELDQLKTNFFSNITHEFRTPLTLVINPLEKVMTDPDQNTPIKNYGGQFQLMLRNARRLLQLINQLLDTSKIESGDTQLELSRGDIIIFIKELTESFFLLARDKGIHLHFHSNIDSYQTFFDKDKLEKILYNLLSNAIKFTEAKGEISLEIAVLNPGEENAGLSIKIKDTGEGIPKEALGKIFDRFYSNNPSGQSSSGGTGIGLYLTKKLVELFNGEIQVKSDTSKENHGTCFQLSIPLNQPEMQSSEQERKEKASGTAIDAIIEQSDASVESEISNSTSTQEGEQPVLLIVEDNKDIRKYIMEELSIEFTVKEAANGAEGLKIAESEIPDIIISDVMMPEMDGITMCNKLKINVTTSHIPIILLTARASTKFEVEGLNVGADDYVTKPFNLLLLKARIFNLINNRKKLRAYFSNNLSLEPKDITTASMDDQFIKKVMEITEKELANPDFGVNEFARALGFSRTQLYRKFQALTGQTVKEFIRAYRLKYALKLLETKAYSISEIAYQVGFRNHPNFTRAFQKHFGYSPSDYLNDLEGKK
ncbi:hybrid sensor histidine kinase/response regulator transcription factor [Flexithrix dorotheae]|uniref:hybrid sensor histidine kinase/response regulator transcription factor n=1 Tax=Flexithrix dorotheae TaxID=70993 RepID=UPI00037B99B9|nr:hybrid sensor histidine kinase/response regulator transcription factor [Flexithrix dorotheae]